MKLSIIVPVYNVKDYLAKCLDSLINQDLPQNEYEIIVVNDGSTDNSGEIAEEYSKKYSNIILINQENQGLSGARNTGIANARGEFVQFVDSDDYLEPNVLGRLLKQIETDKLEVLRFNYQNVNEFHQVYNPYKRKHEALGDYSDKVITGMEYLNKNISIGCYAVMFIIQRSLIKNCLFELGIYGEDTEWLPRMMLMVTRIASTPVIVYNYLIRNGSITNPDSEEKKRKILNDELYVIKKLQKLSQSTNNRIWFYYKISEIVKCILSYVATDCYSMRMHYISELKKIKVFPIMGNNLTFNLLIKYNIINISPLFYVWLMNKFYGK